MLYCLPGRGLRNRVDTTALPAKESLVAKAPETRTWLSVAALTVTVLIIGLDITIMNVALPTMASELGAGTSQLQWIVNAYILMFAGLMLPIGALADRHGRRLMLLVGLVTFGAASVLAAWSATAELVTLARGLLGVGAAIIMPSVLATIAAIFPPEERGKALSVVVMGMGAGIPLGPIIGGFLLERYWWGSIFLINVPFVVMALVAALAVLPESKDPLPRRMDVLGGLLSTIGLIALVYGFIESANRGWTDGRVLLAIGTGLALLIAFIWWELRASAPMIDLKLFRSRQFTWGNINATVSSFALFGILFVVPLYLQFSLGNDPFNTGLRLLPMIGGFVIGVGLGTRVATRIGYKLPIGIGMVLTGVGLLVGATTSPSSTFSFMAVWLTITGFGIGAALTPSMDAVLAVLPPDRAGSGTAITMTLRQAGGALGVAILGSVLSQTYQDRLDVNELPPSAAATALDSIAGAVQVASRVGNPDLVSQANAAYIDGMVFVLLGCVVVAAVAAVMTFLLMPSRTPSKPVSQTMEREAVE